MRSLRASVSGLRRNAWFAFHRSSLVKADDSHRPRLLVDLSVIARHDARTGIQRVVRAIWSELQQRPHPDYDFVPVYAGSAHGYRYAQPSTAGGLDRTRRVVRCRPGDKFLGLDLTAHYLPNCVEQLSAWRAAGATIHHVVYDLLPLRRPEWFTRSVRTHFERWFAVVKGHSDQLLCISEAVANDVRNELGGAARPEIKRLPLSGDIAGSMPSRGTSAEIDALRRRLSDRPTILMVGTVEPRKGYDAALAAFDWLWASQPELAPDLLIVGKAGWQTADLQDLIRNHPAYGARLHWMENVSDEALTEFYDLCSAVLVASRGEGFGLPLSEAAFHEKWVLARDLPVFTEQGLTNSIFFSDESAQALGGEILDLLAKAAGGAPPTTSLPNWDECLDQLLATIGIDPRPGTTAAAEPSAIS